MTERRQTTLGSICKFYSGDAFQKSLQGQTEGDIPFIKVSDLNLAGNEIFISRSNNWISHPLSSNYRIHPKGAVVFAKIGIALTYNRRRMLTRPTIIDNNMMSAVADGVDDRWFYYLMRTLDFNEVASGSALPYLTVRDLSSIAVITPSLQEQRKIGTLLAALDDKIELNRRMNETLEALARALFRDWFVDFGPVKAKIAGAAPYLTAGLWSLFPDRLDDDGVPEGWTIGSLERVASLNPETWSAKSHPSTVEYVDLANTKWGTIESTVSYSWADAPSRARRVLRAGDTIVGTVRPGNGSFAFVGVNGMTGSTGFAVLRPRTPQDRSYTWCAATDPENIDRLAHLADGGAYPAVRPELVSNTVAVFADDKVRDAFEESVGVLLDRIEHSKLESKTLAQTRDLLLPKLMSGEIRVGDVEHELASA